MKPKLDAKAPVPKTAIWWLHLPMHPLCAAFGCVLRRLRAARGWSLHDLSAAAHLSKSYLSDLENGEYIPSLEVVMRLEAALGLARGRLERLAAREAERLLAAP